MAKLLIAEIRAECSRVRRAIPDYEEAWWPSGSLARQILDALVDEGEASIELGDVKRMTKALAELRGIVRTAHNPAHNNCRMRALSPES